MADTTNILDLPISPQTDEAPNITMDMRENIKIENPMRELQEQRGEEEKTNIEKQKEMNQLVTGIQQASGSGETALPSRDIPMNQLPRSHDEQVKPNFVPQAPEDYISKYETHEEIIKKNTEKEKKESVLDSIYEELQLPILLAFLFFLFQLPILKKLMYKFIPALFHKDGNPRISGYIVNSILFALTFYTAQKSMKYLSQI
jgi:hypothetical protein